MCRFVAWCCQLFCVVFSCDALDLDSVGLGGAMENAWRDTNGVRLSPNNSNNSITSSNSSIHSSSTTAPSDAGRTSQVSLSVPSAYPSPRNERKRILAISEDSTEALAEHVKKCRVSSTPGELRLKKDLVDCELLRQQGVARLDKTAGNPLKCKLTFLRPIAVVGSVAASGSAAGVCMTAVSSSLKLPTTFSILVPKFYPHQPPMLYAERCFSQTCSFVREDGQLELPFLTSGAWSSVRTIAFVVQSLLQGLQKYAAGLPQPWGKFPEKLGPGTQQRRPEEYHLQEHQNAPTHEAYFVGSDDREPGVSTLEGSASERWGGWGTWNGASTGQGAAHGEAVFGESSRLLNNNGWTTAEGVREKAAHRRCSSGSMDVGDSL